MILDLDALVLLKLIKGLRVLLVNEVLYFWLSHGVFHDPPVALDFELMLVNVLRHSGVSHQRLGCQRREGEPLVQDAVGDYLLGSFGSNLRAVLSSEVLVRHPGHSLGSSGSLLNLLRVHGFFEVLAGLKRGILLSVILQSDLAALEIAGHASEPGHFSQLIFGVMG